MVVFTRNLTLGLVLSLSSFFIESKAQTPSQTVPITPTTPAAPGPTIDAPSAFLGVASASNKNYIFYQGGQLNVDTLQFSNELYSLDLTKSWPKSNPSWANITTPKKGTLSGPRVGSHSAAMSDDGTTLFVTAPSGNEANPFLYQYDIASSSWSTVNAPAAQASVWTNRKAADLLTDPLTGALWFLGGSFTDGSSTNAVDKFESGAWTSLTATPSAGTSSSVLNNFSAGTAHISGNRIYIFGGFSSTAGQRGYQSFQNIPWIDISSPTPTFGSQLALGLVPLSRQDHCSVHTASQKIIIYGGYDANSKKTYDDVWSLDLITWTWTQTMTINNIGPRYGHTCNIAGANMVVFGGMASAATGAIGYGKDIQVYDVMLSTWMASYAPKQDTSEVSKALPGSGSESKGLGTGAVVGIILAVFALIALILGGIWYKRRQKQIEIREAEMEKEAYLASLRPENGSETRSKPSYSPRSPSAPRAGATPVISSPSIVHGGPYNGMDELLLNSAAASPGMGGQGQPNVQYLMQHLPDGTIAVQPVYLDHQAHQMQPSPNMLANTSGYVSPHMAGASGGGYVSPPPAKGSAVTSPGLGGSYIMPPSMQQSQVSYPQPTQDPFASPTMPVAPLPPGYHPTSGPGSP
ncbi:hypothetical protein BGZ65_001030 [Modicella reniformis]|uniref:Galactose oxidase n=1 Tax=Modicella reniformis TaxID=1440133 RepID=A0A9P6IMB7_9FUNG|nr:hypothetical protein BGZ65_001030 [Modicella reniformis]